MAQHRLSVPIATLAAALSLAIPPAASAQSNSSLQKEIDFLKQEMQLLKTQMQDQQKLILEQQKQLQEQRQQPPVQQVQAAPAASANAIDPSEFNSIVTKVEALIDDKETAGFKGLRVSGGIDPTYLYVASKKQGSFLLGEPMGDSAFAHDNSWFGVAYLDFLKEMEGGSKFRLTLVPNKNSTSFAGSSTSANIVHEASASIPLSSQSFRMNVGQIPDVSGYELYFNTFAGQNGITVNQLYPQYPLYFISHNLLFDFTEANFYTGAGLDYATSSWQARFYVGNFNAQRNGINCTSTPTMATVIDTDGNPQSVATGNTTTQCAKNIHPALIYNFMYFKDEFWGFEFTGYHGNVTNWVAGGNSRLDQFEIDGNYTRGDINANWQFTIGRQKKAAYGTDEEGNPLDAKWWGFSGLVSQKMGRWVLAARYDYLNNSKNGGGTFGTTPYYSLGDGADVTRGGACALGTSGIIGDYLSGFGPGDPCASNYDPNRGANRSALSLAATYRINRNVAFRGELRYDWATEPVFYYFDDQTFKKNNSMFGVQTIVNF